MRQSLFPVFTLWLTTLLCRVDAQDACNPCADGLDPFLVGKVCENGIALAANLTSGTFSSK